MYIKKFVQRVGLHILLMYGGFVGLLVLFTELAEGVVEGEHLWLDEAILRFIHGLSNPFLDMIIPLFSTIGGPNINTAIVMLIVGILFYKNYRSQSLFLLLGAGGAALASLVLKVVFHRTRPSLWKWIITESNYSFPSGHAMVSAALVLCIVLMVWRTKWRYCTIVLGGLYVFTIGLTRLYLGVHYPSDVMGGWLAGGTWVLLVYMILKRFGWYQMRSTVANTI